MNNRYKYRVYNNNDERICEPIGYEDEYWIKKKTIYMDLFKETCEIFLKETNLSDGLIYEDSIYMYIPVKKLLVMSVDERYYSYVLHLGKNTEREYIRKIKDSLPDDTMLVIMDEESRIVNKTRDQREIWKRILG